MKGPHVQGMQGFSLAEAIDGTAPGGVSADRHDPPPMRCRWGCGTVLSIANRRQRTPRPPPEAGPNDEEMSAALVESGEVEAKPDPAEDLRVEARAIRRGDSPDDALLCSLHHRMTHDWHLGLSEIRPAHYPPEEVEIAPVKLGKWRKKS